MKTQIKMSLCLCLSGAFLTACGDGGGGGDSDGNNDVDSAVSNPVAPFTTGNAETVVSEPVSAPVVPSPVPVPVVTNPASNPFVPDAVPAPEVPVTPAPEVPVTPDPNLGVPVSGTDSPELSKLLGNTLFVHRFVPNGDRTYTYAVDYNSQGFSEDGSILVGAGTSFDLLDGTEELIQNSDVIVGCSVGDEDVFCAHFFDNGAQDLFLFPFLADGVSFGIFEFCSADQSDDCVEDLLTTADGEVLVINDSAEIASLHADSRSISNNSETDSLNYRLYEDQSSPSFVDNVYSRQNTDSEELESRLAALKALAFER